MTETPPEVPTPRGISATCPNCGGRFGPPVSGDLHCYVECRQCRSRFELDDPELAQPNPLAE